MPTENDTRVRVDGLSKMTATARGPASGCAAEPVGLHPVGQVEHLDQLVGRQVVVAQEVPGHGASLSGRPVGGRCRTGRVTASRIAGRAATNESACVSVRTSGGTSRTTSGATALTRKPRSRSRRLDRGRDRRGQHDAEHQPGAAHVADQRVAEAVDALPVSRCPSDVGPLEQAVALDRVEHGERGGAGDRVAAERACRAGRAAAAPAASPKARQALTGRPPPRPLASVRTSGLDAGGLVGEPGAGAADAGLHLVERRAARRASRVTCAGRLQVAVRRAARTPPSPSTGSRTTAAVRAPTAGAQRGRVAVRHEGDAARAAARTARAWPAGRSGRARPSCGRGTRPRRRRPTAGRCAGPS